MAKEYTSFKELTTAIYTEKEITLAEFLGRYQKELYEKNDFNSIMHAKRLKQYQNEIFDEEYISELQMYFIETYYRLKKEYPKLQIKLKGRIKSFESFDPKVVSKINKNVFSVEEIHDTLAFRFIINGNYPKNQLINLCYDIMNTLIEQTTLDLDRSSYTPGKADSLSNIMTDEEITKLRNDPDNSEIIIPSKSKIKPQFQNLVKDYLLHPKTNLYQSLHTYFTRQPGGQDFEIQVRTHDMDVTSEIGNANWNTYKKSKYQSSKLDRERIHLEKYKFENGILKYDYCGFQKHREILLLDNSY